MEHHISLLSTVNQAVLDQALTRIEAQNIIGRIWDHDHTVWRNDPEEITNRLGWLHLPETMAGNLERIKDFADSVKAEDYTNVLLTGMGGSSLAPEVFSKTFGPISDGLDLETLDTTHPDAIQAYGEKLNYAKTLFIVSTKSGGTVETLSFFKYFYNKVAAELGKDKAGKHFTAITDPGSKLETLAKNYQFRETFLNDPNIGGRYSVLSYFGLVPAALIGLNLERLLERASTMTTAEGNKAAAYLGAFLGANAQKGRDKLTVVTSPAIASFGDWVEQLVAESTGKEGKGILPIVSEPLGSPAVYGPDRMFVHLRLSDDDTSSDRLAEITAAGHPVAELKLADRYDLGRQFFLWEMATAVAGHILDIHPFDQPNVESAKKRASAMVNTYQESGNLPQSKAQSFSKDAVNTFVDQANFGDYVAIQAYLQPTRKLDEALETLRLSLRKRTKLPVTIGYGPRFLHSTGQLHKGDGGNGLFIQLTVDANTEIPIPETAGEQDSSITFNVLLVAQALGDGQALQDAGRRVIRFDLGRNPVEILKQI